MVRIGRARIVGFMARVAIGGYRGVVAAHMAQRAGDRRVRTRQREGRVRVIERRIRPNDSVMAKRAVEREARGNVIRIGGAFVVGVVAAVASGWRGGEAGGCMAQRTGDCSVSARQREWRFRVIERGASPSGRGVADGAIQRIAHGCVVRIGGAVVVSHMATAADRRCIGEAGIGGMAEIAGDGGVRTRERERCRGVIESGAGPGGRCMACGARRRETRGRVERIIRIVVIRRVA